MANLHRDGAEVNGPGPQDPPDNPRKPHENPGKPPETPRNVPETPGNGRAQAAPLSLADRLPPQNLEAEQGLLGSILLDNDVLPDVVGLVTADDFYRDSHQVVYRSILGLHEQGKAIDAITLVDDLIRRDQLQAVGGHEAISQVLNSVPHAANARYYAEIVRQKAIGRLLIDAANEILRDGYSNNFTAEQLLEAAERKISDIAVAAHASAGSSITWVEGRRRAGDRMALDTGFVHGGRPGSSPAREAWESRSLLQRLRGPGLHRPRVAVTVGEAGPARATCSTSGRGRPGRHAEAAPAAPGRRPVAGRGPVGRGPRDVHHGLQGGAIAPVPKILRDFWPFLCSNPAEFDSQKTLLCKYV